MTYDQVFWFFVGAYCALVFVVLYMTFPGWRPLAKKAAAARTRIGRALKILWWKVRNFRRYPFGLPAPCLWLDASGKFDGTTWKNQGWAGKPHGREPVFRKIERPDSTGD